MAPDKDAQKGTPEDNELENLSSDEKAAFEKIMSEIAASSGTSKESSDDSAQKGKATAASKPSPAPQPMAAQGAPPAADAQANLDQIMSEISAQRKGDEIVTAPNPVQGKEPVDLPADALSNEQQAALDSIMAEIGTKRKAEKTVAPQGEAPTKEAEALNEDQQAALNNIMASIASKRKGEKENAAEGAGSTQESEPLKEDQQADLQKIMAEIEEKKSRDAVAAVESAPRISDEEKASSKKQGSDNLTMEEFDDELSSLLSSAQTAPPAKAASKAKAVEAPKPETVEAIAASDAGNVMDASNANAEKSAGPEEPQAKKEYPILKEVSADPKPKAEPKKGARSGRVAKGGHPARRTAIGLALVAGLLVLGAGGYWAYRHQGAKPTGTTGATPDSAAAGVSTETEAVNKTPDLTVSQQPTPTVVAGTPEPVTVEASVVPTQNVPNVTPAMMLASISSDLGTARQQIQNKISDIHQLKSYYLRGVEEETQKIEDALQSGQIPSFDAVLADKKIELGLRAIQRRQTYIAKLETPLAQLTAMSEQVLYMGRRARTYEILHAGIGGLPIEGLKKEVDEAIVGYQEYNTQISIDRVEAQPPALETIWRQIASGLSQKANLMAQRAPLNRAIGAEIGKGNYDRKYLLSALSAEVAQCLVKWDGKDLYLNALTELTPEVAQILAQWPGEWISLNGLRELPAESAKYLSQWPGRRISLNGLSSLSPEATAYLSKWKGTQLEMVGLQSIGSWENYGTRLFLSEKLQRQLEVQ